MKKVLSLVVILMIICATGSVYAANFTCKLSMTNDQTEYKKGDQVVVTVNVSDITSNQGLVGITGTLSYDKTSLSFVKIEGQNGWSKPSYNEENGKFVTETEPVKTNQAVMKITFKVNSDTKKDVNISLQGITASDGSSGPINLSDVNHSITIKSSTTQGNNGNTSSTTTNTTNKDNTTASGKIPQTGENSNMILTIAISSLVIIAIVSFVKLKSNK